MFGCGKFDGNEMLLYADGLVGNAAAVEEHLMSCAECLDELTELNRINAEMEVDAPAGMKLPGFITVFSGVDKFSGVWNIARAIVSAAAARWEPVVATRGAGTESRRMAVITLDAGRSPFTVRISPEGPREYRVSVGGDELPGCTVEIRKTGAELPVFSRKADKKEVTIANLEQGDYELTMRDTSVRINLREQERS